MANDEFDPFQLSTGLPDDLDIDIQEAWFEFDPEYNDGQSLLLRMRVSTNDEDFGDAGVGVLQYGCGQGWSAGERGAVAVRDDGNMRKGFNNNSAYGLFISAALDCDGAEKVLRSEGRGDPRKAAMWAGTKWHVSRKDKDYGGDIGKISRLLPDAFNGEGGTTNKATGASKAAGAVKGPAKAAGPVSKAPVAKKAAGPVQKAAPAAVEELPADGTTGEFGPGVALWDALYAMALEAADHESFMEAAFSTVEGVSGVEEVEAAVMATGPGSMWQTAVDEYEASQA